MFKSTETSCYLFCWVVYLHISKCCCNIQEKVREGEGKLVCKTKYNTNDTETLLCRQTSHQIDFHQQLWLFNGVFITINKTSLTTGSFVYIPVIRAPMLKPVPHWHNAKMLCGNRENPQTIFQMTSTHTGWVRITSGAMFHLDFYSHPPCLQKHCTLHYQIRSWTFCD